MTSKSNSSWVVLGLALVASLWFSEARAAKGSFKQTVTVDEAILLDVKTGSGTIDIRPGSSGKVEISAEIKVGKSWFGWNSGGDAEEIVAKIEANPPIELVGGELRVGHIKDRSLTRNVSISYDIVVPANTRVRSNTGSGSQTIAGVAEVLEADSGSGRVMISDINGPVMADTGSGSIHAENVAGAFDGDTGSGRIYFSQTAPGDVTVSTGSGSIELHDIEGSLHARAGSGRVRVSGRQDGTWDIDTGSGSVQVDLPDDASFQLDAESSSGGIVVDHPVTVQGKVSKRHLRGQVRAGGDLLKIDTASGGIRID